MAYNETPNERLIMESTEPTKNASELPRKLVKFTAAFGTSYVIGTAIRHYVPAENRMDKIRLAIGAAVLSSIVSDYAGNWTVTEYDKIVESFRSYLDDDTETETDSDD